MSPIYPCDTSLFSETSTSSSNSLSCSSSASTTSDSIDSTSSSVSVKGSKCGNFISKVTCCLPEEFKRNDQVKTVIPDDCELGYTGSSGDPFNVASSEISHYQMSSTRKLAFGAFEAETFSTIQDEKKARHLKEFYNNTTLSNIAKLFSACVLISALFILIRRILSWNWPY